MFERGIKFFGLGGLLIACGAACEPEAASLGKGKAAFFSPRVRGVKTAGSIRESRRR